jgi:hypothetical protein
MRDYLENSVAGPTVLAPEAARRNFEEFKSSTELRQYAEKMRASGDMDESALAYRKIIEFQNEKAANQLGLINPGMSAQDKALLSGLIGDVQSVTPSMPNSVGGGRRNGGITNTEEWSVPNDAKNKFPEPWGDGSVNKKGVGVRWQDPENPGNGVRIDKGNLNNTQPAQQVDHVVVRSNGKVVGSDGSPISGSVKQSPEKAHIPLIDYIKWKKWNSRN